MISEMMDQIGDIYRFSALILLLVDCNSSWESELVLSLISEEQFKATAKLDFQRKGHGWKTNCHIVTELVRAWSDVIGAYTCSVLDRSELTVNPHPTICPTAVSTGLTLKLRSISPLWGKHDNTTSIPTQSQLFFRLQVLTPLSLLINVATVVICSLVVNPSIGLLQYCNCVYLYFFNNLQAKFLGVFRHPSAQGLSLLQSMSLRFLLPNWDTVLCLLSLERKRQRWGFLI